MSFAGILGDSTPSFDGVSSRSRSPDATLALVTGRLMTAGITRVANITGLDRIGVPVFLAVRPNSRALAVSQGKGITPAAARISAVMEAIEGWHAERAGCLLRIATFVELTGSARVVAPELLPLARHSSFAPTAPIPWAEGIELESGERVWVPFELVHANATLPLVPGSGAFVRSTNGLASGNTLAEAALHGVCEVIERDATALWERSGGERGTALVDTSSFGDPACRSLLARIDAAGVDVLVWNLTSDLGVPVFRVAICERQYDVDLHPMPAALGMGCHLDAGIALCRAVTEACQSRLTIIAGSRDDLARRRYRDVQSGSAREHYAALLALSPTGTLPPNVPRNGQIIEDDLRELVARVRAVGAGPVIGVDLSLPEWPIHVVRMIIPGLEGPSEHAAYRPGRRALRGAA